MSYLQMKKLRCRDDESVVQGHTQLTGGKIGIGILNGSRTQFFLLNIFY